MFGIEISSGILIIAILAQMAIIAILIFIIFFKIKWINSTSTSVSKNTELDKKVDNKLTGLQVSLSEILREISSATKEQKESISKVASIVAAAAGPTTTAAAGPTTTTTTVTAPSDAEVSNSASTAGVLTAADILPITESVSFSTKMEPFASAPNVNAAIPGKASTLVSESFDRSEDSPTSKSEFLEIDLDHDSANDSNIESDALYSELQKGPEVVRTSTYGPPDTPASTNSKDSNSHHDSIGSSDSHHYYHPQSHNHLNRHQRYSDVLFESNSRTEYASEMIRNFKETENNNNNNNKGESPSQNQNYHKIEDSDFEKLDLSSEKNSNPELDKIDKEILNALQRLGDIDSSDDNDTGSYDKEKTQ
ncbi:MAG TPA: hypothetical protein VJR94_07480 [Candidatus Nitrosocosmicus sp.]|nr:hypothetical protein [Candidatus Nitrosocosmicus sp.]